MSQASARVGGLDVIGRDALEGLGVEEAEDGRTLRHRGWEERIEGLVCGITTAGAGSFGVSGSTPEALFDSYGALAEELGFARAALPMQVHGSDVIRLEGNDLRSGRPGGPTLVLTGRINGQVTESSGWLLASTAADCVPVYAVDAAAGVVGLAHAGWRGVASGILGHLLDRVAEAAGSRGGAPWVHLGPAICGACYEVDRPVLEALGLPGARALVDLRGLLAAQASQRGLGRGDVSVSAHCTRCSEGRLHSHRGSGGGAGRMAAFVGIRQGIPRM